MGNVHSTARPLEDGVPQGSILSVTLFAVAINSVISVLPKGVRGSLYVDDLSVSVTASRMTMAERKLQLALIGYLSGLINVDFVFHPLKLLQCTFVVFVGFTLILTYT